MIPAHCISCHKLQIGKQDNSVTWDNHRTHKQIDDIAYCDKFPDGELPANYSECLDMPELCQNCDNNTECHKKNGYPHYDEQAYQDCMDEILNDEQRLQFHAFITVMDNLLQSPMASLCTRTWAQNKVSEILKK